MLSVKIRPCIILLLVCGAMFAKGQAQADSLKSKSNDSIQIKLNEYKKLYDAGAIDEEEYNRMKGQLQQVQQTPVTGSAQHKTSDSTQVKLDQLKKLFDTGVIGEDEYARSRARILGLPVPDAKPEVKSDMVLSKTDTMPLNALRDRAKSKIIAGSVILGVGAGFIIGDILMASLSPKLNKSDSLYSDKLATRRGSEIALGVLGGVAGIGGAVFVALGLKDRAIYRRRNKSLTMNFTGKEIEIAFVF